MVSMFSELGHSKALVEKVYVQCGKDMEKTVDKFLTGDIKEEAPQMTVNVVNQGTFGDDF